MLLRSAQGPDVLGPPAGETLIRTDPEMLFYLYLPIFMPGENHIRFPERLGRYWELINQCLSHENGLQEVDWCRRYVYLTVKTLLVTPEYIGGRPGWHTDGFGTDDINYIWASDTPTEFCLQHFDVSEDEHQSIVDMTAQADEANIQTFGNNVLRLTPEIVHRCPIVASPRLRTFFRLSISKDQYNMAGNSHNYLFDYKWDMQSRGAERNVTKS